MLLLDSHDRFEDLIELNLETGRFDFSSRSDRPDLAHQPVHGTYAALDSRNVFFYRQEGVLHLRTDEADIELTDDTIIEFEQGWMNALVVLRADRPVLRLEYRARKDDVDQWRQYLNPMIEDEHLDFGQYIYEVMSDSKRRNAVYQTS